MITQTNGTPPASATAAPPAHAPCEGCGAGLDERQRYCVHCGRRRPHVEDPAIRLLGQATRRRRSPAPAMVAAPRRTVPFAIAALIAALPLLLGAGVLIGRSSAGGDAKLIAALRAEKAPVVEYSGAAPAGTGTDVAASGSAAAPIALPVTEFALPSGFSVELGTLPAGTGAAAAQAAEQADTAKGAKNVALLALSGLRVSPAPKGAAYIVIAGAYHSKADAEGALRGLRVHFPHAVVVEITQSGATPASAGGKVLTQTQFGTAHQVTGYTPNAAALAQGAQVAQQDSHSTGQDASGVGLPDVVAVP